MTEQDKGNQADACNIKNNSSDELKTIILAN